jgi:hypothetical protein
MYKSSISERCLVEFVCKHHAAVSVIKLLQKYLSPDLNDKRSRRLKSDGTAPDESEEAKATGKLGRITEESGRRSSLYILEMLIEWLRCRSPNQILCTDLYDNWSRFKEAVDFGEELRERAKVLCLCIEDRYLPYSATKECVYFDTDSKILYVDGIHYNAISWPIAARPYLYYYKHISNSITSSDLKCRRIY